MKKTGLVVIVVVALCLLGLPPVLGRMGESQIETRIARLNTNDVLAVEVLSFENGWFTSQATVEVGMSPVYAAQLTAAGMPRDTVASLLAREPMTVQVDITHGPVALADGVHVGLYHLEASAAADAPGNRALQQRLGLAGLPELRGTLGYLGRFDFDADMPAVDFADETSTFSMTPWQIEGTIAGERIVTRATLDTLYYAMSPIAMTLTDIRSEGDNQFLSANIALGTVDITIADAILTNELDPAAPMLDASDVTFRSQVDLHTNGTLLDGSMEYSVASARTADDMQITDGRLKLAVGNLDADALQEYIELANRYVASPPEEPEAMLEDIRPLLERLLAAEPRLAIEPLHFLVDGEPFTATVELETAPDAMPAAGTLSLDDPTLWQSLIVLDAEAQVAKPLAETLAVSIMSMQLGGAGMPPDQAEQMARAQAGFMLVTLVGQGMLLDEGDNYVARLTYENGSVTLNGAPLPFGL